jgi:ATP-dependent helicase/DNAse subunit B
MPLTLVVGPANAAKAGVVFGRFRAAARDAPLLVVPRREDVALYERELAGEGALLGGRVVSFGTLLREIGHRTGVAIGVVGPVHRTGLVARAVRETPLEALARSAQAPGFVPAAETLISELRSERVDPRHLAGALAPLGAHGREVASLYGRYVAFLERTDREDEEGRVWRTADALRERRTAWGRTPVLLYGFDDLSRAQRDVVETLADHAGAPVTVSLAYEPRRAFAGRVRTFAELEPLADEVIALEATEDFYAPAARAPLHALERRLFEDEPDLEPVPAGEAVRIVPAAGARADAEVVACEIARLRSQGIRDDEIAVVLRSPREDGPLVERVLAAAGIATARVRERPLGHTALGRGLLGMARTALAPDAAVADLLAWLRAPGVLDQPERADQLEADCRRAAITDAAEARRRWEEEHFELGELDRLRLEGQSPQSHGLLTELARAAEWLFVRPRRGQAPVLGSEERLDALALGAATRALTELRELGPTADPADVLEALAAVEVRDPEPVGSGAVLVTDPLGIRARRFRAVILAGLEAESFPRPPRPEPFLSDDARGTLAEAGIVLRRDEHAADEEAYLFYAAASRATDALVLVERTADEEGNPHRPSPFVAEVERHLAGARADGRGLADVEWPPGRAATGTPAPADRPLAAIASREVLALARHGTTLSAGAVEAYASCPARWLVEKELDPTDLEPDPEAIRRGSIVHEALERTHSRLKAETGTGRVTPANRARAAELLDTALGEARRELGADLPPVVAESIGREIAADLRRYLEQAARQSETPFEPRDFELGFGMEEDGTPPLVLGEGEEAIGVRGRIDRIDVDPAGRAIVRDYKSGKGRSDQSANGWLRARQLQVGLYMLAVRDLLGLVPAGGLYQPLKGSTAAERRPRGLVRDDAVPGTPGLFYPDDVRDQAGVDEVLAAVEAEVRDVARRLRAGEVVPRPDTCGWSGQGCRYPGICRSGAR